MYQIAQHRYFRRNQRGRDFVVSDVHGEFDRLQHALRAQDFNPELDRLFALGDLVDRGSRSADLIGWLEKRWFFSVLGNHELLLLDGMSNPACAPLHQRNGGGWFYRQSGTEQAYQAALLREHLALAFTIDTPTGEVGLIHATAPSDWRTVQEVPLEEGHWQELVWDRSDYHRALEAPDMIPPVRHVNEVVHGHVSCPSPIRVGNRTWIDTLYRGGQLTLMPLVALSGLQSLRNPSHGN